MQAAISTHSTARNFPCCPRYVLHVSQMILDTTDIDLWTGRFLVWMYWIQPKTMPTKADDEADQKDGGSAEGASHERNRVQVGYLDVGLACANRRDEGGCQYSGCAQLPCFG